MRRLPVQILFGISIVVAFVTFDVLLTRHDLLVFYRRQFAKAATFLEDEAMLAKSLLTSRKNFEELKELLESRRRAHGINFWILLRDGKVSESSLGTDELGRIRLRLDSPGDLFGESSYWYVAEDLGEGLQLVVGLRYSESEFLKIEFGGQNKVILIRYLAGIIAIAIGLFAFFFRDIRKILAVVQNRQTRVFDGIKTRSRESALFVQGLSGYERAVQDLHLQNQTLGQQVLPALKKEILSGRTPPYDFNCTLVRTDINNFSKIFHTHSVDDFMRVINDFFKEVSHIVSRYNGLVHEFVGDEVIFYFKDEDHPNSFMIALSALRDINRAAARIHGHTMKRHGYPFTVKSSLAHGTIRFGPLVNGYSMAGSVLIETVRILAHVVEKDGNVIYFDGAHLPRVTDLCEASEAMRVQLKGLSGARSLFRCGGFAPLERVLGQLGETGAHVDDLTYYRDDASLIAIIDHLRVNIGNLPTETMLKAIQILRGFQVTRSEPAVREVLISWLDHFAAMVEDSRWGKKANRIFSAGSMLVINLVPRNDFDREFEDRLSRLAGRLKEKRAVANVLEVLTHFKSGANPEFFADLLEHENNRIVANAIVHEGIRALSPAVIKRLGRMMKSKSAAHRASALHAVGELAAHHRERDIVYYSTNIEFLRLVQAIPGFVTHDEPMVRRQALIAARKAADPQVIAEIRRIAGESSRAGLEAEVVEHLGPPIDAQAHSHAQASAQTSPAAFKRGA